MSPPQKPTGRTSTTIRLGRPVTPEGTVPFQSPRPRARVHWKLAAAAGGMIGLVVFAVIGVVLSSRIGNSRANREEPAVSSARVDQSPEVLTPAKPYPQPEANDLTAIDLPLPWEGVEKSNAQDEAGVHPQPAAQEPEKLLPPRILVAEPEEVAPAPRTVIAIRPQPDTTDGPEKAPALRLPVVEKPKNDAAARLADTQTPQERRKTERFGTAIDFLRSQKEAFEKSKKDNKVVMVLYAAGEFENKAFTCESAEQLREALREPDVGQFVNQQFVALYQRVATPRNDNGFKPPGNVFTCFCLSDGTVLHAIAGAVDAEQFLHEARWLVDTRSAAIAATRSDRVKYDVHFKKAHTERFLDAERAAFDAERATFEARLGAMGFAQLQLPRPLVPQFANVPMPPQRMPARRPAHLPAQAQVDWLLGSRIAPKMTDVAPNIYRDILGERSFTPVSER